MDHFGMIPRTIQVDSPNENGDVEALNGVLKRRIEKCLLLRGSRDFRTLEIYQQFLHGVLDQLNATRRERLKEELKCMRVLEVDLRSEHTEYRCVVRTWSTINVQRRI